MKAKKMESEIKAPPTPGERAERYRGVVSKLRLNEELAKQRVARVKVEYDKAVSDAAGDAERHAGAKAELRRLLASNGAAS